MPRMSVEPVRVFSAFEGQDDTGLLVLYDARLAAVFVKLGSMHGDEVGWWHLEVGFGACTGRPSAFRHLSAGLRWVGERCLVETDQLESDIVDLLRQR